MITIFNRKELCITFSMQEQSEIREKLKNNKIKYYLKTINRNSPSAFGDTRARSVTLGQKMELAYEYIFFIHKDDLAQAKGIVRK
jgi:hypothetical protein